MEFFEKHILSIILFTPVVGILPLLFIPGELAGAQWNEGDVSCSVVRRVALGTSAATDGRDAPVPPDADWASHAQVCSRVQSRVAAARQ